MFILSRTESNTTTVKVVERRRRWRDGRGSRSGFGVYRVFISFNSSLLPSSSTRESFYPLRPSGQAVVRVVLSSSPGTYVPVFLARIGFSIPTVSSAIYSRRSLLNQALALSASHFYARKNPYEHEHTLGET